MNSTRKLTTETQSPKVILPCSFSVSLCPCGFILYVPKKMAATTALKALDEDLWAGRLYDVVRELHYL